MIVTVSVELPAATSWGCPTGLPGRRPGRRRGPPWPGVVVAAPDDDALVDDGTLVDDDTLAVVAVPVEAEPPHAATPRTAAAVRPAAATRTLDGTPVTDFNIRRQPRTRSQVRDRAIGRGGHAPKHARAAHTLPTHSVRFSISAILMTAFGQARSGGLASAAVVGGAARDRGGEARRGQRALQRLPAHVTLDLRALYPAAAPKSE